MPFVDFVAKALGTSLLVSRDVRIPRQLQAGFERIEAEWGTLDFLLTHSIAFAPQGCLHERGQLLGQRLRTGHGRNRTCRRVSGECAAAPLAGSVIHADNGYHSAA